MSVTESLLGQERTRWFSANQKEKLNDLRSDAWKGNWEEVYKTYEQERELRTKDITGTGDTVLHMAVSSGGTHVVKHLVDLLERDIMPRDVEEQGRYMHDVLGAENHCKNTPLHLAAIFGNVEMCITICGSYRDPSLIKKKNVDGQTPLFLAALYGMKEAFIWLHRRCMESPGVSSDNFAHFARDNNEDTILHCAIEEGHFDVAFEIVHLCKDHMKEMMTRDKQGLTPLHLLAAQPSAFKSWGSLPQMQNKETHTWSLDIMNQLLQHASDEDMDISETVSEAVDTALMIAAKNGVIEMVDKILQDFPSAINTVNKEGKNIVLVAAEKGQTKLYQFLWKNEKLDKRLFSDVDDNGNTALHLAAKFGVNLNWQTITIVEEYKWFQFVKSSVPSVLWEIYNNDGKTAEEIFRDTYKEQMASDRKWLNQTSQACSVVSTLVATMAFTYISGENYNTKKNVALVALSMSLASSICFLAILAFRSQYLNFWRIVASVLQFAFVYLFGSIAALWINFMLHAKGTSVTIYALLGLPSAILIIFFLHIFIGPTFKSIFTTVPHPRRNATSAIYHLRQKKKENGADLNKGS